MLKKSQKQIFLFGLILIIFILCVNLSYAKQKVWFVNPLMTRVEIQGVIDMADDGDTIFFRKGVYDFSNAPFAGTWENKGALEIVNKTLRIKGHPHSKLKGAMSELDEYGYGIRGINAFHVDNLDTTKDVIFDGLNFETFLRGVAIWHEFDPSQPDYILPNTRNVIIKNCTFTDVHRDAISLGAVTGNIIIRQNKIEAIRGGMFISWYWTENHQGWQSAGTILRVEKNTITSQNSGILFQKANNFLVRQNIIDTTRFGIYIRGAKTTARINSNTITNSKYGIYTYGNWADGLNIENKRLFIKNNTLLDITSYGISLWGDLSFNHRIRRNRIDMLPDSKAGISVESHDDIFLRNKINGEGNYAFQLTGWDYSGTGGTEVYAHNELLKRNKVKDFTAYTTHYYLDWNTYDNKVIGCWDEGVTYIDNGTNNIIMGINPASVTSQSSKKVNNNRKDGLKKIEL